MRKGLLIVGTFALMVVSGAGAALAALDFLMRLGMKYHDNYEYYGQMPAVFLILLAGITGFTAPAIFVVWLQEHQWRVSLRALLTAMAVIAVFLGAMVFARR